MIIKNNDKPLCAISYDTKTFIILNNFIKEETGVELHRIDPKEFIAAPTNDYQYINLVIKDFEERKQVSNILDTLNLDRFTYINTDFARHTKLNVALNSISIGLGCMLYPGVWLYSGKIGQDVIMHSWTKLAENVEIGDGCFLSGDVTIAGDCKIGNFCYIGTDVLFFDHVNIPDNTKLLPGLIVRKTIKESGTYFNPYMYKLEKLD